MEEHGLALHLRSPRSHLQSLFFLFLYFLVFIGSFVSVPTNGFAFEKRKKKAESYRFLMSEDIKTCSRFPLQVVCVVPGLPASDAVQSHSFGQRGCTEIQRCIPAGVTVLACRTSSVESGKSKLKSTSLSFVFVLESSTTHPIESSTS